MSMNKAAIAYDNIPDTIIGANGCGTFVLLPNQNVVVDQLFIAKHVNAPPAIIIK